MGRIISTGLSAGAVMLLSACSPGTFSDRPAGLRYAVAPDKPSETERKALIAYHARADGDRENMSRREYRDSFVWRQIAADDDSFYSFVRDVRSDRALMNMSADGGAIILNGIAAVTGTAGEKAALAVLSGGLLSAKGSVDRELFNLEAMSALMARMKAARLQALVPIKRGLTQDTDTYPLERALVDLRAYSDAGSLLSTIGAITADAGKVTQEAEAQVTTLIRTDAYRATLDVRNTLADRVEKLQGNQTIALAYLLERSRPGRPAEVLDELAPADPDDARFHDTARAKRYLFVWLAEDGDPAMAVEFDRALSIAEKGRP